jgi:hypothetical protein
MLFDLGKEIAGERGEAHAARLRVIGYSPRRIRAADSRIGYWLLVIGYWARKRSFQLFVIHYRLSGERTGNVRIFSQFISGVR